MKLDGELSRLALEHGTMLGPPTEVERAEERVRKERARKVRGPAVGTPSVFLGELTVPGFQHLKPNLQTLIATFPLIKKQPC